MMLWTVTNLQYFVSVGLKPVKPVHSISLQTSCKIHTRSSSNFIYDRICEIHTLCSTVHAIQLHNTHCTHGASKTPWNRKANNIQRLEEFLLLR